MLPVVLKASPAVGYLALGAFHGASEWEHIVANFALEVLVQCIL